MSAATSGVGVHPRISRSLSSLRERNCARRRARIRATRWLMRATCFSALCLVAAEALWLWSCAVSAFGITWRACRHPDKGEVGMSSQRVSGTAVQRTIAVLGSAVFFVVAPCTLAGLVPWSITGWQLRPPFLGLELTRGIGAIMILAGVPGLVDAFARFALQGLGTPAPIAPTRNLVVTGLYRYVRNPIYVAVVAIILGQAVLMGDWRLIVYGALLWLFFHVFVVAYEEPTLEQTFGREYEAFRAAVPRWIPRMTPWRPE